MLHARQEADELRVHGPDMIYDNIIYESVNTYIYIYIERERDIDIDI